MKELSLLLKHCNLVAIGLHFGRFTFWKVYILEGLHFGRFAKSDAIPSEVSKEHKFALNRGLA